MKKGITINLGISVSTAQEKGRISQLFLLLILYLLRSLERLHFTKSGHYVPLFRVGGGLLSWIWIVLSILVTSFLSVRGTQENTLR